MSKKYIIAQNREEIDVNFNYITKNYFISEKQKRKKSIKKNIENILKLYGKGEVFYQFNKDLSQLYIDEIELFYLNNNFNTKDLHILKCYLQQKRERKNSIFLPIVLSIIASIIYGLINVVIWKPLIDPINTYFSVWKTLIDSLLKDGVVLVNKIFPTLLVLGMLILLGICLIVFFIMPLIPFWILIKAIATIVDDLNFNRVVVYQYELEFLDRIAICEKYFELIEKLDKYADCFFGVINQLAYNYVVSYDLKNIDSIVEKIFEFICNNKIINYIVDDSFNSVCEKRSIIKSIIYRNFLKLNDKSSILVMHKRKFIIRKNDHFFD